MASSSRASGCSPSSSPSAACLIYRGVARWYTDDGTAGFQFGQSFPTLEWLAAGRSFGIPHSFITFILVAIIMGVVLHRSVFGRYLYAVGKNEEAARYSGIRTERVIAAAYIICGGLAGLAAVFFAMYTRSISPASHGNFYELYGIAAAGAGRLFAPRRRGLGAGDRARLGAAPDPAEPGQSPGHPELP